MVRDWRCLLTRDDNKGIDSIVYNHLNLPWKVYKSPTEYIEYTYDATGRKLRQQVFHPQEAKVTDYAGELIFENDTLQFINTEEGRVVMTGPEPEYQYYLKDHLGSIRTTFSEKHTVEEYVATLETSTNPEFLNHNNRSPFTPYNHTPSGTYSQLLNGGYNGQVGLAKSFAVEPGDVFDLEVYAKYEAPTTTPADPSTLLAALFSTFSLGTGGTGLESQAAADVFNGLFGTGDVWIDDGMYDPSTPRAYLNFILFDENFGIADFGFQQVTDAGGTAHELLSLHVKVEQKGYLYVYLSNEQTVQTNVYWDDFRIVRHTGVVEVDDYYPFGLTFNSYQRENSLTNRWKFQGQEHIDDLNLGWDSFKWRNHQPEIGRFFNVDPLSEKYYYNSTYAFSENKVIAHRELEGLEAESVNETAPIPNALDVPIVTQTETQIKTEVPSNPEYKEVVNRPYDLKDGERLPSEIVTTDGDGNGVVVKIEFGRGFPSDGNHTPDNEIASYAVEGYVEGVKNAIKDGTCIESLTVTATTNGHHGAAGRPNWDTSSSNHYVPNGADAIDTNLINGQRATKANPATAGFQKGMQKVSNISENFGATYKSKPVGGHETWVHTAFKRKDND